MTEYATWRDLLAQITRNPYQRRQLARLVGVTSHTIHDWSTGASTPRYESLHRLIKALPSQHEQLHSLITKEFPDFAESRSVPAPGNAQDPPSSLYAEILSLRASASPEHRARAIARRLIAALLDQLDARHIGIIASLVLCTPAPSSKAVRSLYLFFGQVLPSTWEEELAQTPIYLLGADTLAGYAAQTNRTLAVRNQQAGVLPHLQVAGMQSAVVCPLSWSLRIAGSLYVASQQDDDFLSSRLHLIEAYASLATLALDEQDFYPLDSIALSVLPPVQQQAPFIQEVYYEQTHRSNRANEIEPGSTPHQIQAQFWHLVERRILDGKGTFAIEDHTKSEV